MLGAIVRRIAYGVLILIGVNLATFFLFFTVNTPDDIARLRINNRVQEGSSAGGNGVVIDHGGGWISQYSHLRSGSVRVHPGDRVSAGQPLGLVQQLRVAHRSPVENRECTAR